MSTQTTNPGGHAQQAETECLLEEAYWQARDAGHRYAALNTALAGKVVHTHHPEAEVVRFELHYDGDNGWGASLVSVRDAAGRLLWHVDDQEAGDVGDDSTITDRLATAEAWGHDYFPAGEELDETGARWQYEVYELNLSRIDGLDYV